MKRSTLHRMLALLWALFGLHVGNANAAIQTATGVTLNPYANSSVENPGSFAASWAVPLSAVCTGIVYIAPEDKHLLALAWAAKLNGTLVNIKYEDNATPAIYGTNSGWPGANLRCKLLAVWLP